MKKSYKVTYEDVFFLEDEDPNSFDWYRSELKKFVDSDNFTDYFKFTEIDEKDVKSEIRKLSSEEE